MSQLALGGVLAVIVAGAAWRAGALSRDGAAAAAVVGAAVFGIGGFPPAVLLVTFFVSSSALSFVGRARKTDLSHRLAKGAQRDWVQVTANGGLAGLLAVGYGLLGGPAWLAGVTGALASATADTWATELGVLAQGSPRMITTGRRVRPGTSGGVTAQGTLASLAGGCLLGGVAGYLAGQWALLAAGGSAGLLGSLADSFLGASLQARYDCPSCRQGTEQHPIHLRCGTQTELVGGWGWLDNDGVNLLATGVGAVTGWAIWTLM
ncbi:MAG: DUF92 domain-containing protein [Anaerolineales bacterium]|nr:DUF92 domain-containing protein [Anaerolineales bacterium]